MKDLIQRGLDALGLSKPTEKDSPRYHAEKKTARSGTVEERRKLASKKSTRPEILYYLAADEDESVRHAVAKNKQTPAQADIVLAKDTNVDIRLALAKRLMDLLPNLSEDKQSQLYSYAVNSLATLARDEILKVRIALSSTLKDHAFTPPVVASQLAKDAEQQVAEPMLRFCVFLSDDDLIEILAEHPAPWALTAIASRAEVNEPVSHALIETDHPEGGQLVIANKGAKFYPKTIEAIVQKAALIPAWQSPIVQRKDLPEALAKDLAMFVDSSLLKYLEQRSDYSDEMREEIVSVVRRRIDFEKRIGNSPVYESVMKLYQKGELNEEIIGDALSWHHKDFVIASLAILSQVQEDIVRRIIDTKAPKPIVSLVWRADLSMRLAIKIQQELAKVPYKELLLARGGLDYPLDEKTMLWQLEFFGIKEPKKNAR